MGGRAALPQLGCFQCSSLASSALLPGLSLRSGLQRNHPPCESFSATDILKVERPTALCSLLGELQKKKKKKLFFLSAKGVHFKVGVFVDSMVTVNIKMFVLTLIG